MSKSISGQVGYCENKNLKGLENIPGGHYVYITKNNKNGTCEVNVITSLEQKNQLLKINRINQVRNGNVYPIPYKDANFSQWSGVSHNTITTKISKIQDIGKKKIKDKHKFYLGKFLNK